MNKLPQDFLKLHLFLTFFAVGGTSIWGSLTLYTGAMMHASESISKPAIFILLFTSIITFVLLFHLSYRAKTKFASFIKVNSLIILVSILIIGTTNYLIYENFQNIITENIAINKIADPIIKEAATAKDPILFAEQAVKEALTNQGKDPNQYTIIATLPNGYEFQKKLKISITYPVKRNILPCPLNENSLTDTFSEPLTGPNVLKATLEKAENIN